MLEHKSDGMEIRRVDVIDYLKRWFDKPVLSKAEGLTTNGGGPFHPFVLSLSKDGPFWIRSFEIVSKSVLQGHGVLAGAGAGQAAKDHSRR